MKKEILIIHPKQKVIQVNKKKFKCDLKIIPLIKELNKVGLKTKYCCQGSKNSEAYISLTRKSIKYITIHKDKINIHWNALYNKNEKRS